MPRFASPVDGAQLFYYDYVPATDPPRFTSNTAQNHDFPPLQNVALVFIHGWPMNSLMFEHLMLVLCEEHRFRCIAVDRRGFGKSDWSGRLANKVITYDVFAEDTIHVVESLEIEKFVFVAASMGCGETLLAYNKSPAIKRKCQGFVWMGPSLPFPIQTPSNPTAPSRELWDSIFAGLRQSRSSFTHTSLPGVFGAHVGVTVDPNVLQRFERIVDQADALAMERCVQIITNRDFTKELQHLAAADSDVPLLILQGDSDQGMPFEAGTKLIQSIVGRSEVEMYDKAGHGLYLTHSDRVLQHVLRFTGKLGSKA